MEVLAEWRTSRVTLQQQQLTMLCNGELVRGMTMWNMGSRLQQAMSETVGHYR